jgi:hypothetical protein
MHAVQLLPPSRRDARGRFASGAVRLAFGLFDPCAETRQSAVQRNLDRIRLHAENLTDLPCAQVSAIPQRNQVLSAIVELFESADYGQPFYHLSLDVLI